MNAGKTDGRASRPYLKAEDKLRALAAEDRERAASDAMS
jgi:hypothetical protein